MAAQNYYSDYVVNISNIVNVADNTYTDLDFASGSKTYTEGLSVDYSTFVGCGEGNETAVTYILLYLVENGILTHRELWDIAKESACDNFSDFMQTLYENVDKSKYTSIGKMLESQNIVDRPIKTTSTFGKTTPGTFKWICADTEDGEVANDTYLYLNQSRIVFWDLEYNIIFETEPIISNEDEKSMKLSATQWKALVKESREKP